MHKILTESSNEGGVLAARHNPELSTESAESQSTSTLIEFPGSRNVPEWRKQLSQRVREVQEQKAREVEEEEAALRAAETVSCALPSGQLELVPDREQAPLNPIVSKALERVDRARRGEHLSTGFSATATAPALAPAEKENVEPAAEVVESKPKLTIVTPAVTSPSARRAVEEEDQSDKPKRVRVISERVEASALSYLETCLSVPALSCDSRKDVAGLTRRTFVGVIDLLLIALMISPAAWAIYSSSGDWSDSRAVGVIIGLTTLTIFAYLTISIALTGRTLGMLLLSVRTIDERTGLIPTGGQSIKRALGYIFSLALLGLGLAFALIDREQRTLHDRFSKTIVVRD